MFGRAVALKTVSALLLAAMVLVACGDGDDETAGAEGSGDEAPAEAPAEEEPADDASADDEEPPTEGSDADTEEQAPDEATGEAQFVQELADRLPQEIADEGVMRWVGHPNPPTRIPQDDGSFEGVETDLAQAVETILDIEVEQVDGGGLGDILLALESERYDFFIGPLKSTFERQEDFDFIVWMYTEASYIYSTDLEDPPASADELCGMSVSIVGAGVLNSFTQGLSDECEERGEDPIEIMEFADREGGILAVDSGRAQAHGTTSLTALYYQSLDPDGYDIVTKPIGDEPDPLGAVVSNARPELGELMYDVFLEMQEQGVYQQIVDEWNLGDAAADEILWNYAFD